MPAASRPTRRPRPLDATDAAILDILQHDARTTNADIARKLHISPASSLERVRKLERNGVIRQYVALLDPDAVGQPLAALVSVTLREHGTDRLAHFKAAVRDFTEVQACWHMAGESDFILRIAVPDMATYERFVVDRLSAVPNVGRIQTSFILDTVKETTALSLNAIQV